jgi:hypothetical protein
MTFLHVVALLMLDAALVDWCMAFDFAILSILRVATPSWPIRDFSHRPRKKSESSACLLLLAVLWLLRIVCTCMHIVYA